MSTQIFYVDPASVSIRNLVNKTVKKKKNKKQI